MLDLAFFLIQLSFIELPWWLRRWRIWRHCRTPKFDPWVGKIPWRRAWQHTPIFLPGQPHEQRNVVGYSQCGGWATDTLSLSIALCLLCVRFSINTWLNCLFGGIGWNLQVSFLVMAIITLSLFGLHLALQRHCSQHHLYIFWYFWGGFTLIAFLKVFILR